MTTGTVSLLLSPGGAGHQGPTRRVRMFMVSAAVLAPFAIPPLAKFTDAFFFSFIYFEIPSRHITSLYSPLHDIKRYRGELSAFCCEEEEEAVLRADGSHICR